MRPWRRQSGSSAMRPREKDGVTNSNWQEFDHGNRSETGFEDKMASAGGNLGRVKDCVSVVPNGRPCLFF